MIRFIPRPCVLAFQLLSPPATLRCADHLRSAPSRVPLCALFGNVSRNAPGSIASGTIFEDNPAVVRAINNSPRNGAPPIVAYDTNETSTCVFVSNHPNHWNTAFHLNTDLHGDFSDVEDILSGIIWLLRPNSCAFLYFVHKRFVEFAGFENILLTQTRTRTHTLTLSLTRLCSQSPNPKFPGACSMQRPRNHTRAQKRIIAARRRRGTLG